MGSNRYDIIVIGGGHAGCEAASAAARMGAKTAMITLNPSRIGFMSCNPAIGGLAKGQLVKEIDALGGLMGRITDRAAIQYRRLNESKGPAVRSSRAQCDKDLYAQAMQAELAATSGLDILGFEVRDLLVESNRIAGVQGPDGSKILARAVIITSGTFLRAVMHTGESQEKGGRVGDPSAEGLSDQLQRLGFRRRRLKTGTPPRLHKDSIDWSRTTLQPGDKVIRPFSFYQELERFPLLEQRPCHITYTNEEAHEIIAKNKHRSPVFSGAITGAGPRYCPSIEDKVDRFRDKSRHQIFLEPEGLNVDEIYVNGISTSLPAEVQVEFVHKVPGLERAEFLKFGYAVEYDAIDARQLHPTFGSKDVEGLYFGGQICGTSGYEEAAAQGLMAGINAAGWVNGRDEFVLGRDEAYIGVMADDLTLKGSDEPYRMFTSRAEYRLLLREDNADVRLSRKGHLLGLLSEQDFVRFESKMDRIVGWRKKLTETFVHPSPDANARLEGHQTHGLKDRASLEALLKRPQLNWSILEEFYSELSSETDPWVREQVETQVKYQGYIKRDLDRLEGLRKSEGMQIPASVDYDQVAGLSNEIKGRLKETRPGTLGQASRMQGVTPAAVANLLVHLKIRNRSSAAGARK